MNFYTKIINLINIYVHDIPKYSIAKFLRISSQVLSFRQIPKLSIFYIQKVKSLENKIVSKEKNFQLKENF
jgi:hypothetical protein